MSFRETSLVEPSIAGGTLLPDTGTPQPSLDVALPEVVTSNSLAITSFGRAAYTLFRAPEHDKLHEIVEDVALGGPPQPLHAPVDEVAQQIGIEVLPKVESFGPPKMGDAQLIHMGAVLIQFTDYVPRLHDGPKIPYEGVNALYEQITDRAEAEGPLGFTEQLDTALEHADGNLVDALWQLFITSRLHGRWLDSKILSDIPDYTKDEKVALMQGWRDSIAACKSGGEGQVQDPGGDAYYTWTHALAKVLYNLAPARPSLVSRASITAFHFGTVIMHNTAHVFNKQSLRSNHTAAAAYGNAIGQVCVEAASP